MKILTLILTLTLSISFAQTAEFGKLIKKSNYDIYLTKNGDELKIGDTLTIGIPSSDLGFTYISQSGQRVSSMLSEKKIIIDKLKTYGNKTNGYKMYAQFKGYGLIPVIIDYETAFELGEIRNSNAKLTRKQAISKLKEAKDLFDLGMMSKDDYEKMKSELKSIIMD